jgi:hypothetical protein
MRYLFYVLFLSSLTTNSSAKSFWQKVAGRSIQAPGVRKIIPQQSNVLQLDDASFRSFQSSIPKEETGRYVLMSLPLPDGPEQDFRVFERMNMEQPLADKYPMIKTYEGISVSDPSIVAKLDYTTFGFHAMVFSHEGIYFIDPYTNQNTGLYNCYYKKNYTRQNVQHSVCETKNADENISTPTQQRLSGSNSASSVSIVPDGARRTFRLALSCTIEYSKAVAGNNPPVANVLSAIVTSINRVNGVYEKELSIHMNLVAHEDTLIFTTADNFSNLNGAAMLGQNQTVCDARIGTANYDIGHVFSTGGGGIAGLGVVCDANEKANGVTGSSDPTGDAFDIDYVVHEMGHQFGANHTFNASTGSCFLNSVSSVAYEVGSGTTIMAYAGICDANDTQLHSDDYFHRASINEIYNYISGTSCAVITAATSVPPMVASYTATYNIPYKTSFEITASATDAQGNPVSYCWEEYDLGPQGNWNVANNTKAPIFRSFLPSTSGTRVFPKWDSLIRNVIKYKGEILPEVARDVKFRCTVRDVKNGYGIYNAPNSDLLVKAVVTPTLFRVTSNATAGVLTGLTSPTITWDVANTTASPISCSAVDIFLSLDSARTFPITLATGVPNTGTAVVALPNVSTINSSARIKVKGSNNIFFDLNDGWLKINAAPPVALFTASDSSICAGGSVLFTNTSTGSPDSVRWTINGATPSTSSSSTTVSAVFNNSGTFIVSMVAYKSGVGSPIFFRTITVKPNPTVVFTPSAPVTCAGDSIDITANYIAGATGIWSTGSSSTTIRVAPVVNTYYSVTVTNDGCSHTDSVQVKVNPKKSISLSQTICEGESVTIGVQSYNANGNYTAHLQTSLGCDSAVNLALTVTPRPSTPVLDIRNDSLNVTASTGTSYLWYLNGTFQVSTSIPQYKPTQQGTWTAIVSANNCESANSNGVVLTGLKVRKSDVLFSITPNPNMGNFEINIAAEKNGDYKLMLYNVTGQELMKEDIVLHPGVNTKLISMSRLEKGMYFISLKGRDGNATQNFIVQ